MGAEAIKAAPAGFSGFLARLSSPSDACHTGPQQDAERKQPVHKPVISPPPLTVGDR